MRSVLQFGMLDLLILEMPESHQKSNGQLQEALQNVIESLDKL
jgi:hypothetical protein